MSPPEHPTETQEVAPLQLSQAEYAQMSSLPTRAARHLFLAQHGASGCMLSASGMLLVSVWPITIEETGKSFLFDLQVNQKIPPPVVSASLSSPTTGPLIEAAIDDTRETLEKRQLWGEFLNQKTRWDPWIELCQTTENAARAMNLSLPSILEQSPRFFPLYQQAVNTVSQGIEAVSIETLKKLIEELGKPKDNPFSSDLAYALAQAVHEFPYNGDDEERLMSFFRPLGLSLIGGKKLVNRLLSTVPNDEIQRQVDDRYPGGSEARAFKVLKWGVKLKGGYPQFRAVVVSGSWM